MVTCNHINPASYIFCGTCGGALERVRCRCGFVAGAGDVCCGRCGISLVESAAGNERTAVDVNHRFDLEHLAQLAEQENKFLETTNKARVTQDDIRKLLIKRRRKF